MWRVRFEIAGKPEFVTSCNCQTCRKTSGAPFITWVVVMPENFSVMSGSITYFKSSAHGNRGFCAACGTSLSFHFDNVPGEMDVSAAVLDHAEATEPIDHIWMKSKLQWVIPGDGLPQLEKDHLHEGYPD